MSETPLVRLQDAHIRQAEHLVLSDVSFSIEKGEFVYLIGATGSGKSSLLKTLYGDLPLHSGSGSIAKQELGGLKDADIPTLRRKLGIVFQDFQLLTDRSIADNLSFVLKATGWKDKKKMEERISEVLEKVGMAENKNKMPYQISGGEQQRVAICRALLTRPQLILADEPTGNLDPKTKHRILDLLFEQCRAGGMTLITVTHDTNILSGFDRTIDFEQFRIDSEEVAL